MNLSSLDWSIVCVLFASLAITAIAMRRYTQSVSGFLAGERCAGRYLLTMSEGLTALGLIGTIANFEKFYQAGFAASWWGTMMAPVAMIIALTGWVSYRYRQTRAMTMAQFFEARYSRRFRIFAGIVAWVSGVLNYGVFPGIIARFIIYFCGLPTSVSVLHVSVPTIALVMAFMLSFVLVLTLTGGMITVMVVDFVQAQFINVAFLVVMVVLFRTFAWGDVAKTLAATPPGKSLINPFNQGSIADFNVWFFLIFAFKLVYNRLGWQGTQGFNCAAKSPHEAKMAGVLAEWRGGVTYLILMLMPIGAYVLLHGGAFPDQAATVNRNLAAIADPQTREQMTVPVALVHLLPSGVVGLLCAALLAATIGNDTTFLHAWGSIFVQDVLLPFRKTPFTPQQHLRLLRLSIMAVAAFAFVFSLMFPLHDYVVMYQLVTGAIYLGGSGVVIIGGLYWSRGTTAGAWSGMCVGGVIASIGAAGRWAWPSIPSLAAITPQFPLNGAWVALIASLSAIVVYVVISLLTCRRPFDLDRLLHRDEFDRSLGKPPRGWRRLTGMTAEFTRGDRAIYYLKFTWTGFWIAAFIIGTTIGATVGISDHLWLKWWLFTTLLGAVTGVVTVVWFVIGGSRDLADLVRALRSNVRDETDNGMVLQPAFNAEPMPADLSSEDELFAVTPAAMPT